MKLYFAKSATADNYIIVETSSGIQCSNCAPTGEFAGVDLCGENPEYIVEQIAAVIDVDSIDESDFDWMGAPCYSSFADWQAEQDEQEYFNRDEAYLIAEIG